MTNDTCDGYRAAAAIPRLYDIMKEKDALYAKSRIFPRRTESRAAELEGEFAELDGWEAESRGQTSSCNGLGIGHGAARRADEHTCPSSQKVKVLLAQALFGSPRHHPAGRAHQRPGHRQPSNGWKNSLLDYDGTMIVVVRHDRHFLNAVCTHIVDIDYNKVQDVCGQLRFLV